MSTVPALLLQAFERAPDAPWLWVRDRDSPLRTGDPDPGAPGWRCLTVRGAALLVSSLARRMAALGVQEGTVVAVVGAPLAAGIAAELAIWALGGTSVALPSTTEPSVLATQVDQVQAEVVLLSDARAHDRFEEALESTATLRHLRTFWTGGGCPPLTRGEADLAWLEANVQQRTPQTRAVVAFRPENQYQSPAALVLTQQALCCALARTPPTQTQTSDPRHRFLLAAPFSSLAGRMRALQALQTQQGVFVCPPADAGAVLSVLRPHLLCAPALVLKHLQDNAVAPPHAPLRWSLRVGAAVAHLHRYGRPVSPRLALQHRLASGLCLQRLRATWGGRLRVVVTLEAPPVPRLQAWFASLGVTVLGTWACTAAAGTLTADSTEHHRPGTVGLPPSAVRLRIAGSGELLLGSPDPVDAQLLHPDGSVSPATDSTGWFHTGTRGAIDPDGFLRLLGRLHPAPQPKGSTETAAPARA